MVGFDRVLMRAEYVLEIASSMSRGSLDFFKNNTNKEYEKGTKSVITLRFQGEISV